MSGTPTVCFDVETSGERKQAVIDEWDNTKDAKTACADMSYPTDMSIPQASDFPDFTMPRIKWTCLLSRYESYGQGGVSHLGGSSSA